MNIHQFDSLLARYARLLVVHGLNVQPRQLVNISAEAIHREIAYLAAKECYARGARAVNIDLIEARLGRDRITHLTLDQLTYVPKYISVKYDELLSEHGANLKIVGPEEPDLFSDLDPLKINTSRVANYKAVKTFYDEGIGKSKVHWTVAAAATPRWGKKVFPALAPEQACTALWEQIFKICRVDREDYLEEWQRHNALLRSRAARLTELGIEQLHFVGPGTDLRVGLSERAVFKGGTDKSPRNVEFEPNIPTEECFTTPDYRVTSGKVAATRPFFVNGKLIKGLELEFHAGKISAARAQDGLSTFQEYIKSDEGGSRLGEVALVGIDSPVFQSGLVFEEILFDENAACHIAVGSAYKFCLRDAESLDSQQLTAIGCNESSVHTDIMISSEHVDVTAKLRDGNVIALIEKGRWCSF